jgi:hypothetical protein
MQRRENESYDRQRLCERGRFVISHDGSGSTPAVGAVDCGAKRHELHIGVKERAKVHLAHFAPIHAVIDTPQQVHVPRDIA